MGSGCSFRLRSFVVFIFLVGGGGCGPNQSDLALHGPLE